MRGFVPREYQRAIIRHILDKPRCAVFAGMGMGKTSSVLYALETLAALGEVSEERPALVLAPLRVASMTWPDEVRKWGSSLRLVPIVGNAGQRERAARTPAEVYSVNYENIPWLLEHHGGKWPYGTIVADESTRLKGFRLGGGGGSRAKALGKIAHSCDRFVLLTGTPAPNGLIDLWGQFWFLDKGERLGKSFGVYTHKFFDAVQKGSNRFAVEYRPCSWSKDEIQRRIADLCVCVEAEDWFPLDKPIVTDVPVEIPKKCLEIYEGLRDEFLAELDSGEKIDAVSAAAKSVKMLQVASGSIYRADGTWEHLHEAKVEALRSVCEEAAGEPVLVAYHWKSDLDKLRKAFPQGRVLDRDPRTLREWNEGRIPLLFAHPASAGHGLNLQDGGRTLCVFSPWWDLEQYEQIIERIGPTRQMQSGHPRAVRIYRLVAKQTLDSAVLKRLDGKASVQDALLEGLKR